MRIYAFISNWIGFLIGIKNSINELEKIGAQHIDCFMYL